MARDDQSHDNAALSVLNGASDAFTLAYLRGCTDCVKLLNPEGRITFMSENGLCAMEIDDAEAVAGKTWWDLWPSDQQDGLRTCFLRATQGESVKFLGACPTAKGSPRDWDVSITPVTDPAGQVTSILAVSRDITAPA